MALVLDKSDDRRYLWNRRPEIQIISIGDSPEAKSLAGRAKIKLRWIVHRWRKPLKTRDFMGPSIGGGQFATGLLRRPSHWHWLFARCSALFFMTMRHSSTSFRRCSFRQASAGSG